MYRNSKSKIKPSVGPLLDDCWTVVSNNKEMAELLNGFFSSVFTKEKTDCLPEIRQFFQGSDNDKSRCYNITADMVKSKLYKLKMNKEQSTWVDSISTRMLLELSGDISEILAKIFNKSLLSGEVPYDWKLTNVIAIFKKCDKSKASNYRPLSLTSNVCKVFESIMRD